MVAHLNYTDTGLGLGLELGLGIVIQVIRRVVRYGDSGLVLVSGRRQQTGEHFYKIWIIADD